MIYYQELILSDSSVPIRKIIHVDMDSFFVAVEMRDNPNLKDKLVAVGGQPDKRGVIATCNYSARKFSVHSAMSSTRAKEICPELIIISGNMAKYKQTSAEIRAIFKTFTEEIEPLSLDEAYLDVTNSRHCHGSATLIAEEIRRRIFEKTSLTASAGVGPNKLIAKIASDINKPNGICVVTPNKVLPFISELPVNRLYGVGKVTLAKLKKVGVNSCKDLQQVDLDFLSDHFGKFGKSLYHYCRGIDDRPVNPNRIRKSVSVEQTYESDISDPKLLEQHVASLIIELRKRMAPVMKEQIIKSVFVKLKFRDFKQTTAEAQAEEITLESVNQLLTKAYGRAKKPVRLIGVGVGLKEVAHDNDSTTQMVFDFSDKCNDAMRQFIETSGSTQKDII